MLLFIYFKAKSYYPMGLYPVMLAFGAVYLKKILNRGWKSYLRPVTIAVTLLLFIPIARVAFPMQAPGVIQQNAKRYKKFNLLCWEDGKNRLLPQDFADIIDWQELANKINMDCDQIADDYHTLVLCDNYRQAGAINYYSKHKNITAYCTNGDYYNWFLQDKIEIKNIT